MADISNDISHKDILRRILLEEWENVKKQAGSDDPDVSRYRYNIVIIDVFYLSVLLRGYRIVICYRL